MKKLATMILVAVVSVINPAFSQAPSPPLLAQEQLDQLVSPIALYPDALLANVLMASTYPLEVVEATRWADANKKLNGDALKAAADKQGWDDSVKQLTATPSVLSMMSTKLTWTQQLGDAVLAQQPDVMDAVQRLRAKAHANNKLPSGKEQTVSVKTESNRQVIVIEPTEPNTVYVPYYDPAVVYGAWPYPAYPPYYFTPPGYIAGAAIATGLAFGAGVAVGAWAANNNWWGGGFGWGNNSINVNRNVNINNTNINNWVHNPDHRHGVRYNNQNIANRFNRGNEIRNNAQNRLDFRGRGGEQVLRPGAGTGSNIRDRVANRPGAGGSGERRQIANRGDIDRNNLRNRAGRDHAFSGADRGAARARADSLRGHASLGNAGGRFGGGGMRSRGGGGFHGGNGAVRAGRGGGGFHGGGGRGRRSDVALKHDIIRIGTLDSGIGFYRFVYNGGHRTYVGVLAQEVQSVAPHAVTRGTDGFLRVRYDKIGVKFQTYEQWLASGVHLPTNNHSH